MIIGIIQQIFILHWLTAITRVSMQKNHYSRMKHDDKADCN